MFNNQRDNLSIVKESLCGSRPIDEETIASIVLLDERLAKLKRTSSLFSEVSFSPELEELSSREMMLAIS